MYSIATLLSAIGIFFLGSISASFAGVVTERIGTGQSYLRGRSRCNACNRHLTALDLFPILSFVFQKGRCRVCSARITARYVLSEVLLGFVFLLEYVFFGYTVLLPFIFLFSILLAIIVTYDLRHTIVPFYLSLVLVLIGAMCAYIQSDSQAHLATTFMVSGAIALFFYVLHVASRGRWMGLGDTPIALALSLVAGSQAVSGLLVSFWTGAVVGVYILVRTPASSRIGIEVPFVPFLAFGYFLALITQWNPLHLI